jgi:hypothetical protein
MKHPASRRFSPVWYLILFLLPVASATAAEREHAWAGGFELSVLSDDNVTRAPGWRDIEQDTITRLRADARYALDFSLNRGLILTGHVLDERYGDFDGLSGVQAGLEAEYRFRTRGGFGAPVYSFYISGVQADYETDIRDGDTLEYGLRVSRQFTDRIALAAGAAKSEREAEGRVFDLGQTRYFAHLDYRVPNLFQTYLAYYSIDGDAYTISSVSPAEYGAGSFYDALERDPAFSTLQPHWAYRLDARTGVLRLGFNIGIGGNGAIDLSIDDIRSEARNPGSYGYTPGTPGYGGGGGRAFAYDTTIVAAGYFYRF